jgi:chromosome segregation ATPase
MYVYFASNAIVLLQLRWQHEMHLKLSKFANLCKNLNEESSELNNECISLRRELAQVQAERNEASEKLLLLRAKEAQHERENVEFDECRRTLAELEQRDLASQKEIRSRDVMLDELSTKLEKTLDQLELERSDHRLRRNVIFPQKTSNHA